MGGPVKAHIKGRVDVNGEMHSCSFNPFHPNIDLEFKVTMNVESLELTFSGAYTGISQDIIPIKIPIIPLILTADLSPKLVVSAGLKASVDVGFKTEFGARFGMDGYKPFWKPTADTEGHLNSAQVTGTVFAGISLGGRLSFVVSTASLGIDYTIGYELRASVGTNGKKDGKIHVCKDYQCIQGDIRTKKGPLAAKFSIIGFSTTLKEFTDPVYGEPFKKFYYSFTFGDGGSGYCPHIAYPVELKAVNGDTGKLLAGVRISMKRTKELEEPFREYAKDVTTDQNGAAVMYLPLTNPSKYRFPEDKDHINSVTFVGEYNSPKGIFRSQYASWQPAGLDKDGKLTNGEVKLTVAMQEDNASGDGADSDIPKTGDSSLPILWAAMALAGLAILTGSLRGRLRRKR